ncbi:MAG: hypothetical protein ABI267_00875 [Ginsengibacter sp.]
MKKLITITFLCMFISLKSFCQDTTHLSKKQVPHKKSPTTHKALVSRTQNKRIITSAKRPMYRDTRLGGSSKKYNTYKKNDNGAGAITNNPNK